MSLKKGRILLVISMIFSRLIGKLFLIDKCQAARITKVIDEDGMSSEVLTSAFIVLSTSEENNAEGCFLFNLVIPFPVLLIVVILTIVGTVGGLIYIIKKGWNAGTLLPRM